MVKLSKETESILLIMAPAHYASSNSPTTYETVKEQAKTGIYHVFSGGSTDTIFSDRKYQYAYRAWHDSIHLHNEIPFDMQSELKVAKLQEEIALQNGVSKKDAMILKYDLECHIEYYYAKGEHPVMQIELIQDCLTNGIQETVNSAKIYH